MFKHQKFKRNSSNRHRIIVFLFSNDASATTGSNSFHKFSQLSTIQAIHKTTKEAISWHSNKKMISTLQHDDQEHPRSYSNLANEVFKTITCKTEENIGNERKGEVKGKTTHT